MLPCAPAGQRPADDEIPMPSSPSLPRRLLAAFRARPGYAFFAGHLLTVWAIALSNLLQGLMILWSGRHRRTLPWDWPRHSVLLVPLGLYVLTLGNATLFSLDPAASFESLREIFSLLTLPLGLVLVRGERQVRRIVDLLVVMVALVAAFGLAQYHLTDYGSLDKRIVGPFSHYQTFAGILLIGDFLILARLVSGQGWRRPTNWLALALTNWTLLLTLTRGPWVALGLTFAAYVMVRGRRHVVAFAVAAALLLGATAVFAPDAWHRMGSIVDLRDPSNYDRLCMVDAGLDMIVENPITGIGPDMVKERYPLYRHPTAPRLTVPHLHNAWVQLAAERGLPALAAYLWLMGAALLLAWRAYRREGGPRGPRADLYVGGILVLVGFNLAGFFEANWQDTEVHRLVLFLMAMPLCLEASPPEGTDGGNS